MRELTEAMDHAKAAADLLHALPAFTDVPYDEWQRSRNEGEAEAKRALRSAGFNVAAGSAGVTAVSFGGVRSSSTMGLIGALSNWLGLARKKLAAMEAGDA
jgi:hypothetical protein